jgi:hypothetical protein
MDIISIPYRKKRFSRERRISIREFCYICNYASQVKVPHFPLLGGEVKYLVRHLGLAVERMSRDRYIDIYIDIDIYIRRFYFTASGTLRERWLL